MLIARRRSFRTVLSLLGVIILSGCMSQRITTLNATRSAEIVVEVESFLRHYRAVYNDGDLVAIRKLYVDDERFAIYEDGELQYPTPQAIIDALTSFPPGMGMQTTATILSVTPLADDLATASTTYETTITMPDDRTFEFGGVMTALLERGDDDWKVITAHTSSRRERGGG